MTEIPWQLAVQSARDNVGLTAEQGKLMVDMGSYMGQSWNRLDGCAHVLIGRYCSIGQGVAFCAGYDHDYRRVTTSPLWIHGLLALFMAFTINSSCRQRKSRPWAAFLPAQLAEGCQVWLFFSQFLPAEKLDEQPEKQVCRKGCCDITKEPHSSHLLLGQEPKKIIAKKVETCYNEVTKENHGFA